MLPNRQTERLRYGRYSTPGGYYFITWCTQSRRCGLEKTEITGRIQTELSDSASAGDFALICATIMPDHVHVLFQLGLRLSLAQVIQKIKAKTSGFLAPHSLTWQDNFFEHQLRRGESLEDFALYIFLNPYRAGLISVDQNWPSWMHGGTVRFRFEELRRPGGLPWPEWLDDVTEIKDKFDVEG